MPAIAVDAARAEGHDMAWMAELAPGDPDERVLARALAEGRVLVTFDKDFGELVFRRGRDASRGVILLRPPPSIAVVHRGIRGEGPRAGRGLGGTLHRSA